MTRPEAHQLLDAARSGRDVSRVDIARALRATGDLDGALAARERHVGDWRRPRARARFAGAAGPVDRPGAAA